MKIELILLGVIGLVFLVDFIMNSRKKPSIDNVMDQIEGGEPVKTNNPLNYLLKRKKNFTIYILSIPFTKLIIHYMFYPIMTRDIVKGGGYSRSANGKIDIFGAQVPKEYSQRYKDSVGDHIDVMFTDELLLFIPAFILVSLVVWFFNDKIKAR
jgi:hypothetical protein